MRSGDWMAEAAARLRHEAHERDGCAVLVPRGDLTVLTSTQINSLLCERLMDRGRLVVDVSALTVRSPAAAAVFASALADAGGWPLARLVLLGATTELATALREARLDLAVWVAQTWDAAVELLRARPVHLVREIPLDPASAAALARRAAAEACVDWELHALRSSAKLVASELVTHAIDQVRSGARLSFSSLAGRGLRIGVRHWAPPRPGEVAPRDRSGGRGRGLAFVERLTDHWGITRHEDGETLWAALGTKPRDDPRPGAR